VPLAENLIFLERFHPFESIVFDTIINAITVENIIIFLLYFDDGTDINRKTDCRWSLWIDSRFLIFLIPIHAVKKVHIDSKNIRKICVISDNDDWSI